MKSSNKTMTGIRIIELNQNFKFKKSLPYEQKESVKSEVETPPEGGDWLPATVPGCVHLDLLHNNHIPDPFQEDYEYKVQWIEECDWIYETSFSLPNDILQGLKKGGRLELQLDSVDTYCSVFLNRKKVATVNNMFIPWRFDISGGVKKGNNELLFYFDSATRVTKELEKKHEAYSAPFDSTRMYARRAQYFTGWDWGPRLSGVGLWRPVRLVYWETARISHAAVSTTQISQDKKSAELLLELAVEPAVEAEVKILAEISLRGEKKTALDKTLSLKAEPSSLTEKITIVDPCLWYPNKFGDQPIYDLNVTLTTEGKILDQRTIPFGIRTVRINQEPDEEGKKFVIEINGEPIFLKGMNWIPADSFPSRLTDQDYKQWITLVAESNANCLRVWGGGIYEHDAFYRYCDEKGITVWHDFMFACAPYPEESWFLNLVSREAEAQIRRLQNHPSIILWCGNNENEWMFYGGDPNRTKPYPGEKIFSEVLPEICQRMDPTRPYWPSSPHGGKDPNSPVEGDRHNWEVWSNWRRYEEYAKDNGRFLSEFGFQAVPRNRTIFAFTKERDHNLNTPALQNHDKMSEGTSRLFRYLWAYLRMPRNFDELSYYSQLLQGEALKLGVQHWRSRKFKTAGALIWQINDCWPVISWSLVDYYKRPKAGYYYARRFYSPILAALLFDPVEECNLTRPECIKGSIRCVLVNDLPTAQTGDAILNVFNINGEKIFEQIQNKTLPPNCALNLGTFALGDLWITQPDREFVALRFLQDGKVLSSDTLIFQPWKYISLPRTDWRRLDIKALSSKEFEISIKSEVYIKCVKLFLNQTLWDLTARDLDEVGTPPPIPEYALDDNFFDLIPNQEKALHLTFEQDVPVPLVKAALTFQTLNDSFSE